MVSNVSANPELVFLVRGLEQLGPGLKSFSRAGRQELAFGQTSFHHFIISRSFRKFLVEVAGQEVAQ